MNRNPSFQHLYSQDTAPHDKDVISMGDTKVGNYITEEFKTSLWNSLPVVVATPLEAGTLSVDEWLYPEFSNLVNRIPIDEIAIFITDENSVAVWAVCEELEEDKADVFYLAALQIQKKHFKINFDFRLIERKGRSRDELGISLKLLRPIRGNSNVYHSTAQK